MLRDIIRLIRPKHWVKNGFVFAPVVFALRFTDPQALLAGLQAFFSFSLAASAVYVINDIADRNADARHPLKKKRPLAAGRISVPAALVILLVCLAGGLSLASAGGNELFFVVAGYFLLNVAYSFYLKHQVLLDVMVISAGFLLRVIGGGLAVSVPVSRWLLLSTFTLTLFLGFCKRRNEILLTNPQEEQRPVLGHYSERFLDQVILISATLAVVCFALYTIDAEVVARLKTPYLLYTLPLVIYGLFRYLFLIYKKEASGDPAEMLLRDPGLIVTLLLWLGTVVTLIWPGVSR